MRHFVSDTADSYAVGVVDVARWEQYGLDGVLPFQAMWYTVPPASCSPRDCHPEQELSIVITGTASVEASGEITDVSTGSAFLLGSNEAHVIHNRSAETPLMIFTTFWMPLDGSGEETPDAVTAASTEAVATASTAGSTAASTEARSPESVR